MYVHREAPDGDSAGRAARYRRNVFCGGHQAGLVLLYRLTKTWEGPTQEAYADSASVLNVSRDAAMAIEPLQNRRSGRI